MTADLRFCAGSGSVVNAARPVAEAPYDVIWEGLAPEVGCNRLTCSQCGVILRQKPKVVTNGPLEAAKVAHLHASEDWGTFAAAGWVRPGLAERLYVCRCQFWLVKQPTTLTDTYYDDFMGPAPSTWACAGHPRLTPPFSLDGEKIGDSTHWDALVRGALVGERALARPDFTKGSNTLWVERLFHLLEPHPLVGPLAEAILKCTSDRDPRVQQPAGELASRLPVQ